MDIGCCSDIGCFNDIGCCIAIGVDVIAMLGLGGVITKFVVAILLFRPKKILINEYTELNIVSKIVIRRG